MSKDLSRVAYTRRIMEIVHNIQRQKEDINKILGDTRMVQKEINQLTGKLERVFTVTDEQVYKDARKDEARRTAYKLLASLREVTRIRDAPLPNTILCCIIILILHLSVCVCVCVCVYERKVVCAFDDPYLIEMGFSLCNKYYRTVI